MKTQESGGFNDLEGIVWLERHSNGSLYVISQESKRILDVSLNAPIGSSLPGLVVADPATQVEGITFSPNYEYMYVVGESRELYIYYQDIQIIEETGSLNADKACSVRFRSCHDR